MGGGLDLPGFGRDPRSSDSLRGVFFSKKTQKVLTKFPGLVTSGRNNSAMIANAENRNSRPSGPPTVCLVSIFTVRINSKSVLWAVRCVLERYLLKFSAIVDGHCGRLAES